MRPTTFGTYDFTAAGIGVKGISIGLGKTDSGLIRIPFADGAFDAFGSGQSPKSIGTIRVDFELRINGANTVDVMLDNFLKLKSQGQQWFIFTRDDAATRRVLAKCVDTQYLMDYKTIAALPVQATFEISEPFWYADTQSTQTTTVDSTPEAIDLNNTGNAPLTKMVMRFTGTAKSPKFLNNTNGFYIQHSGDITSALWEVDTGAQTVKLASVNDWANVVISATQIGLFKYDVGANDVDFVAAGGGTPSGTVDIIYRTTFQ